MNTQGDAINIKVVLLLVGLLTSVVSFAEELTAEKKAAVSELMDVTGAAEIGELIANAFVQQLTNVLKQADADILPRAFGIIQEEVNAIIKEKMIKKGSLYELLYPIYHKYLTLEETKTLIAFYKTPTGRKTISVMPQLTQESMVAEQSREQELGPIIQKRLAARFEIEEINFGN